MHLLKERQSFSARCSIEDTIPTSDEDGSVDSEEVIHNAIYGYVYSLTFISSPSLIQGVCQRNVEWCFDHTRVAKSFFCQEYYTSDRSSLTHYSKAINRSE